MTIKRFILGVLTLVALFFGGESLIESWKQPQIQGRLELYQTNLLLQAQEWRPPADRNGQITTVRNTVIGMKPLEAATQQYQEARALAQTNLEKAKDELQQLRQQPAATPSTPKPQSEIAPITDTSRLKQQRQLQQSLDQLQKLSDQLDLQLGILQVEQGQTDTALKTWMALQNQTPQNQTPAVEMARVLTGLWSSPPRLLPEAEQITQDNLGGWFRYQTLAQLYKLQQRQSALETVQAAEQQVAKQALWKLASIVTIPTLGVILGVGLLIFLVTQLFTKGKESLLAINADVAWSTPWNGETIWQVFILGFFLMGQLLVPLVFSLLQLKPAVSGVRIQAFYVLASYLLLTVGALSVLYLSLKPFLPLPESWFRVNLRGDWFLWGLGGYLVALPLIIIVSLVNQQLWQGQGGSNPLLSLALESNDSVALAIFFFTAAIAAPLFEEFMFRGFLLPSLTRYLPVSAAIVVSSFFFAVAHLSLSELLPLTVLGIILGIVYTRSRNLLASMLLHGLWNSGTLLSLFVLGSGSS